VEYLIKSLGCTVDEPDKSGATALHVACARFGTDRIVLKVRA
jgi:ankyrin repeat protein